MLAYDEETGYSSFYEVKKIGRHVLDGIFSASKSIKTYPKQNLPKLQQDLW
jgi:hypothetical protein